MISFNAYLYDATTGTRIDSDYTRYTIACMSDYEYSIGKIPLALTGNGYFAGLAIANSPNERVANPYTVEDPHTLTIVSGVIRENSFTSDQYNLSTLLKSAYDRVYQVTGEHHAIRLCRSNDPDVCYLEYAEGYGTSLFLKADNVTQWIPNAIVYNSISDIPVFFTYAYNLSMLRDTAVAEQSFVGSYIKNDTDVLNLRSVYKSSELKFLTDGTIQNLAANTQIFTVNGRNKWNAIENQIFTINEANSQVVVAYGIGRGYDSSAPKGTYYTALISLESPTPLSVTRRWTSPSSRYEIVNGEYAQDRGVYRVAITLGLIFTQEPVVTTNLSNVTSVTIPQSDIEAGWDVAWLDVVLTTNCYYIATLRLPLYAYLTYTDPVEPTDPDVDPEDIPPEDDPPAPETPDDPDPYYDPTSDPDNPQYDPTKDPDSPEYDPSEPHTPYRPPSGEDGGDPPVQPPQDPVPVPVIPPAFVTNNSMFTLYNPTAGDLSSLADFLWSPQWSIDTFKKIFANPLDCILGLMVMPHLSAPTSTKEMAVGNIATGVTMRYFTNQFYDFDCGTFKIEEFYASYLDYAPYTKVNIFLPYIGDQQLNTDEVMGKVIGIRYRFDLATGDCVAFVTVAGDVLYSFSGNCASRLPLSGNNWSGILPAFTGALFAAGSMAAGVPALGAATALAVTSMKQNISHTGTMTGSPGLMGIQTPYLIITRPRQALPLAQNSFTGYPSFMTESLGSLSGYTEVESCHLEHIPCTAEELEEVERLLKEGVLF